MHIMYKMEPTEEVVKGVKILRQMIYFVYSKSKNFLHSLKLLIEYLKHK